MLNPEGTAVRGSSAPVPQPFHRRVDPEYHRHIEIMGRAIDELVGTYVQLLVSEADSAQADVSRLAATARRLWMLALDLRRAQARPF